MTWIGPRFATLIVLLACVSVSACGAESGEPSEPVVGVGDPGPIHVHGLGVNPADGALFVATHTGLFRAPPGRLRAQRVGDRFQDTMGFTVTGPDRFLGSGHPDARDRLAPFLGLLRSTDAGRSWEPVSLLGERDFHVLEAAGERVYGYGTDFESRQASLLVSNDGGRSWQERTPPEPLISLAIDPDDPDSVVASGERGTYSSSDAGHGWRPLTDHTGLLAWPRADALFLVRFRRFCRTQRGPRAELEPGGRRGRATGRLRERRGRSLRGASRRHHQALRGRRTALADPVAPLTAGTRAPRIPARLAYSSTLAASSASRRSP
jgi:hypothetical protein